MGEEIKFKRIRREDMQIVYKYLSRERGRTCDFSYGGVLMWVDYFDYEYCILRDTLFIKGVMEYDLSKVAFSLPIGDMALPESVGVLREYCNAHDLQLEFSAVPEYAVGDFLNLNPKSVTELKDWGDYLYDAEALASLRGKRLSKKRNHVNQFMSNYPGASYESLSALHVERLYKFMDDLDNAYPPILDSAKRERALVRQILEEFKDKDFPMIGGVLENEGRIVAFTFGDVKGDTLFVHVEKADRDMSGSYEMINTLFVRDAMLSYPEIKYVNREDDAGNEGLRRAKLSYHPIEILKKFNIVF